MNDKWHLKNKKGYLKIHVAVNAKTKKILSMKVTDDKHIHDSKALPELVDEAIKSDNMLLASATIDKLFADDGAYDNNDIFRYLGGNGIQPCIKVRKNAELDGKKETLLEIYSVGTEKRFAKLDG